MHLVEVFVQYAKQGYKVSRAYISLAARPSLSPKKKKRGKNIKEREGLAELARNWIRTDQSAFTVENPASDYIIALWFRTSTCEKRMMAFVLGDS